MKNKPYTDKKIAVLIAGIGGGSLGLEIFKSLRYAGGYRLIGTDITEKAYGLNEDGFEHTHLLFRSQEKEYALQLLDICLKYKVDAIAPGAEEVHRILSNNRQIFEQEGILLMINSKEVIDLCLNKSKTLQFLKQNGIPIPVSTDIASEEDVEGFARFPCIVKPAAASGGSNLVFIAENVEEALFFVGYLRRRCYEATLQEYIISTDEFTVGVLSSPSGEILGSIALKRFLEPKLSYSLRYNDRVISSGWSQGEINNFVEVRRQAEQISRLLNSRWALNIQGRLDSHGVFYPFEINPRHSGTTYLRALAGFNEPHILLQCCLRGKLPPSQPLKRGYYLRSFVEKYVSKE